ncbi:MAG: FecR domain-containing protein [Sideroxydans sp.]|nr:FecR domain-containing protein [Sideroxydans sp.]
MQEEALRWFVRVRSGHFTANEQLQLSHWLAQDERHHSEFMLLQQTWQQIGELGGQPAHIERPRKKFAMQAVVAGFLLVSALLLYRYSFVTYESQPGTLMSVKVAEGIMAELDADSAIRISRWSDFPDVTLVRGSAYFNVLAHDSGFQVHVADVALRDIGTRFAAQVVDDHGRVAVEEGQVEVAAVSGKTLLGAGQQTSFSSDRIEAPVNCDPLQVAPWRNGEYRFAAATLADVSDDLWRHSRMRLEMSDARVAALTVSGTFEIGQPDKLVWAVAQIHDLKTRKLADGYLLEPNP